MADSDAPFPDNPEDFLDDPRVSFNKATNRYLLESADGEWEWIANRWTKMMDEALLQQQAEIYKVAGVDESEPAIDPTKAKKRKRDEPKAKPPPREKAAKVNTAIYVTSLPEKVTEGALADFFGRCGLIAESVDTNKPRVKLYYDDNGVFKGEALIVFFRPESVKLAIDLYDDSPFPTSQSGDVPNMHIFPADENYKRHKDDVQVEAKKPETVSREQRKANARDRELAKKKREEMNDRLMDWGEGDPSAVYGDRDRWEDRLVIIQNVFTQASIKAAIADGEDEYLDDIHADMKEEADKFGKVTELTVYDLEEPGIVTIGFATAEAAADCIRVFHGRNYDGRKLRAYTSDGTQVFHKTQVKHPAAAASGNGKQEVEKQKENDTQQPEESDGERAKKIPRSEG